MRNLADLCGFHVLGALGAKGGAVPKVAVKAAPAPVVKPAPVIAKVVPHVIQQPAPKPVPPPAAKVVPAPLFVPKNVPQPAPGGGAEKGGGGIKLSANLPGGDVAAKIAAVIKNMKAAPSGGAGTGGGAGGSDKGIGTKKFIPLSNLDVLDVDPGKDASIKPSDPDPTPDPGPDPGPDPFGGGGGMDGGGAGGGGGGYGPDPFGDGGADAGPTTDDWPEAQQYQEQAFPGEENPEEGPAPGQMPPAPAPKPKVRPRMRTKRDAPMAAAPVPMPSPSLWQRTPWWAKGLLAVGLGTAGVGGYMLYRKAR